jgi:hypothetical protein
VGVRIAPAPYRRHRRHYERGDHDWVVINSAATLAELGEQAAPDRWGPGVLARLGAALARRQQYGSARIELERSCAALASSAAAHELGDGEFSQLQLVEVLIAMGRFCEARTFAERLLPAGHHLASRTGASRGLAAVHLAGGDSAGAHAWLDEAAARAAGLGGDLGLALVHADRAVVVAAAGRLGEAVTMCTEVLRRLDRAGSGTRSTTMALTHASITATTVALHAAHGGDLTSATHLLAEADRRAVLPHRPADEANRDVVRSAVARLRSQPPGDLAERAARILGAVGAEPARAVAVREQAMVAAATGRQASAVVLADHAAGAFTNLGMGIERRRTEALVATLGLTDGPEEDRLRP